MLPRLLYLGDVPVEASYHGSALLHRLLADYPAERLTILETGPSSQPERRLPKVNYISRPIAQPRWLNTRFHPYAVAWFSYAGTKFAPKVRQSVNGFDFECVLTVAHGFGWLAAAAVANERALPLHLIVHDDWPRVAAVPRGFRKWLEDKFATVYGKARSRMCVSPSMQSSYLARYGKPAEILYPGRAADSPVFTDPPPRLARNDHRFTMAFAGTINSPGYIQALIAAHDALETVGGRLLVFGPLTSDVARQVGLDRPHLIVGGLLSWPDLMTRLRDEVDALFVPMSFDISDSVNMEMAFPSKLADYTAAGIPLLIYGPAYCSAVRWARENPGVAEVVEVEGGLTYAIGRLAQDPARRVELGRRALDVGRRYFAHDTVQAIFQRALTSN